MLEWYIDFACDTPMIMNGPSTDCATPLALNTLHTHAACIVHPQAKNGSKSKSPCLPAAFHRMIRSTNATRESGMMICGQGAAERWAKAQRVCGGVVRRITGRVEVRARGRRGSAGGLGGGGAGEHGCMACARGVWGSAVGRVSAAAGAGAVGRESRRTGKLNWKKFSPSMHRGRRVDHGGEDVRIVPDEPTAKEPTPKKQSSLLARQISAITWSTPKSADLTKEGRAQNKNITGLGDSAQSLGEW